MSDNILLKVIRFLAHESESDEIKQVEIWKEQHKEEFEQIKMIFENMPFEEKSFHPDQNKRILLDKINASLKKPKRIQLNNWLKVAAIFIGIISIGFFVLQYQGKKITSITNTSSTIMRIDLPDGSTASLDKQASINFQKGWILEPFSREVNMQGRIYFEVEKKNNKQNFVIHTKDTDVEVLGTKFLVSDQFNKIHVVLQEGKINVRTPKFNQNHTLTESGQQIIITEEGNIRQDVINQNLYFSWLENKLNFDYCNIAEAINYLSDSYNLDIQVTDEKINEVRIFGSAPSDNPILILKAISKITGLELIEEKNQFILK